MVNEDRQECNGISELSGATLPDGSARALGPCVKDAFSVFEDMCLLANLEKTKFLKLDRCTRLVFFVTKRFSFELEMEAEVFLVLLIGITSEGSDASDSDHSD